MPETDEGTDFIVSELLSELKNENERKAEQIKGLHKMLVVAFAAIDKANKIKVYQEQYKSM